MKTTLGRKHPHQPHQPGLDVMIQTCRMPKAERPDGAGWRTISISADHMDWVRVIQRFEIEEVEA